MLQFPVNDVIVKTDLENPTVGMGHGAIELQSGGTKVPFPFQIISEKPTKVNAEALLAAATQALNESDIALSPVRVLFAD